MGQAFEALWGLPTSRQVAKYSSLKGQEAEEEAKESLFQAGNLEHNWRADCRGVSILLPLPLSCMPSECINTIPGAPTR